MYFILPYIFTNYASTPLRLDAYIVFIHKLYRSNNQYFYFFINARLLSTNLYFKLHGTLVRLHLSTLVLLTILFIGFYATFLRTITIYFSTPLRLYGYTLTNCTFFYFMYSILRYIFTNHFYLLLYASTPLRLYTNSTFFYFMYSILRYIFTNHFYLLLYASTPLRLYTNSTFFYFMYSILRYIFTNHFYLLLYASTPLRLYDSTAVLEGYYTFLLLTTVFY